MNLKEKTGDFLKGNFAIILVSISLFLIGIADSLPGLILYTIIIHYLCVAFFIGLYEKDLIIVHNRWAEGPKRSKLFITYLIVILSSSVVILAAREHWYLLVATSVAVILGAVHIIDAIRNMKTEH